MNKIDVIIFHVAFARSFPVRTTHLRYPEEMADEEAAQAAFDYCNDHGDGTEEFVSSDGGTSNAGDIYLILRGETKPKTLGCMPFGWREITLTEASKRLMEMDKATKGVEA
jgi:hypothetical protein